MLLINIMGRLYNFIIKYKKRNKSPPLVDDKSPQVQQITDKEDQEIIINDDKDVNVDNVDKVDEGDEGDKDDKAADVKVQK